MPVSEIADGSPLTIDWLNSLARTVQTLENKVNNIDALVISTSGSEGRTSPIPDLTSTTPYKFHFGVYTVPSLAKGDNKIENIPFGTTFGDSNVFVMAHIRGGYVTTAQCYAQNTTQFSLRCFNHFNASQNPVIIYFVAIGKNN